MALQTQGSHNSFAGSTNLHPARPTQSDDHLCQHRVASPQSHLLRLSMDAVFKEADLLNVTFAITSLFVSEAGSHSVCSGSPPRNCEYKFEQLHVVVLFFLLNLSGSERTCLSGWTQAERIRLRKLLPVIADICV